ncbi:putative magnesium transporter NIPA7 [Fusarium oxysporum f. sp. albedinis]|nr:putative magnesium transporter NIPA7 [Fusarium oxysporum f. sp. albedinis]
MYRYVYFFKQHGSNWIQLVNWLFCLGLFRKQRITCIENIITVRLLRQCRSPLPMRQCADTSPEKLTFEVDNSRGAGKVNRQTRLKPSTAAVVGLAGTQAARLYGLNGIECQRG